jgi:AraC-like DNA-binding protein
MDLLSELLGDVRIAASSIGRFTLSAPFHLRFAVPVHVSFVVLSGRCDWRLADGPVHTLGPGDAVLGLRETDCRLASDVSLPPVPIQDAMIASGRPVTEAPELADGPVRFHWGGDGERTELLAVAYVFDRPLSAPLFHALPDGLVVPGRDECHQSAAVAAAVAFMNAESEVAQPGYAAMVAHMAETLFLGLLRAYALQQGGMGPGNNLRALHEPRLQGALRALHADPARPWTVAALASLAAMSNSVFAQRFTACLGMPPKAYVAALRMHLARRRLEAEAVPIGRLAEALGYRSERAFRKAFQHRTGMSPRQWRRQQQAAPERRPAVRTPEAGDAFFLAAPHTAAAPADPGQAAPAPASARRRAT